MSTVAVDNFKPSAGGTAFSNAGVGRAGIYGSNAAAVTRGQNITSGTDNGTGDYSYSFTNAFDGTDYIAPASVVSSNNRTGTSLNDATTSFSLLVWNPSTATKVDNNNSCELWGDLA